LKRRLLLALTLTACGGTPPTSRPVPAPTGDVVTKTITNQGGQLQVAGARGALTISIPAGAVTRAVNITVKSVPDPAGGTDRFEVTPGGLVLNRPAEVQLQLAAPPGKHALLSWGEGRFVRTTRRDNTLTASLMSLGYPPEDTTVRAASTNEPTAPTKETLVTELADCQAELDRLVPDIKSRTWETSTSTAAPLMNRVSALSAECERLTQAIEQHLCDRFKAALHAAATNRVDSLETFYTQVRAIRNTSVGMQVTGSCDAMESGDEALKKKIDEVVAFIEQETSKPEFMDRFLERELRALTTMETDCRLMGADQICNAYPERLYPRVLDVTRRAAYDECVQSGSALDVVQLYAQLRLVTGDAAPFGTANFTFEQLEADASHCTNPFLRLRVFKDALTIPEELPALRQDVRSRGELGKPNNTLAVTVPRHGSLNISGDVRAIVCPNGTPSTSNLVLTVNGVPLRQRPSSQGFYAIKSNPLELVLDADLPAANLNPDSVSSFRVELIREGVTCGGVFPESAVLFTVNVTVDTGPPCTPQGAEAYCVVDFSTLDLGPSFFPISVNNRNAVLSVDGRIWTNGNVTRIPIPDGFTHFRATGFNDNNGVVGVLSSESTATAAAYVDGGFILMRGGESLVAISNTGVFGGYIATADGVQALLVRGGQRIQFPVEATSSIVRDVNDAGTALVEATFDGGRRTCAYTWSFDAAPTEVACGRISPIAINIHGVAVGRVHDPSSKALLLPDTILSDSLSIAMVINDAGVIGGGEMSSTGQFRAVLWKNGHAEDLPQASGADAFGHTSYVTSLNNAGWMLVLIDEKRKVLLVPR